MSLAFALLAFAGVAAWSFSEVDVVSTYAVVAALLMLGCAWAAWHSCRLADLEVSPQAARRMGITQWIFTSLVWAYPVCVHAYAVMALALVGHWPSHDHPDPKDLDLELVHRAVLVAFYFSAIAILAWAVWFLLCSRALRWGCVRMHVAVFAVSVCALLVMLCFDPTGVGTWYAD